MDELAIRIPATAASQLQALVLPEAMVGDHVELLVRTSYGDLSVRDFAAYFQLVDHVYGRLQPGGFRSYAMQPAKHFRIQRVRAGSLEFIFSEAMSSLKMAQPIAILWLCLRVLPPAIESTAKAYNSLQQGLLARANRKQIRARMQRVPELSGLPDARRNELVSLVEAVLERDETLVFRASRFSESQVETVELRVGKQVENSEPEG